ncbi:DUF3180 domain-containing protein [Rhodococcus spelaei]|uniref:DUF3180 domain-containing protein n=1 Tax=Rhodococcus spelaei TaxID=2546320 RepID=A0A541BRS5_9NOCA|nr:DUF3180 domain-containing protein [Rhodococcus spelaei]TQF75042.1 DUF3180 domain-containing protein [Rhodococcus spelaei]
MKPTRVRDLLGLAAFAAIATWLLVRGFYGSLPPVSVFAGASLYPVAAIEAGLAFVIRARVAEHRIGPDRHQLHPITAARAAALSKASSLVGAASAGVWLGLLLFLLPKRSTVDAAAADTTGAVVGLIAGVVLVAAAMWLEHCCRTPDEPPDEPAV